MINKTIQILEDNIGEYVHYLGWKSVSAKEKIDSFDLIKLKSIHLKISLNEWKE